MAAQTPFYPGELLALNSQAADRLLKAGNGDAALLYLQLLRLGQCDRGRARRALNWTEDRVYAAWDALVGLALVDPAQSGRTAERPADDQPPAYTAADLARELERASSPFPALVEEVQRSLGKILSGTDLKQLFTIYDYLALPAEVILLLVSHCIAVCEGKYGPGRRPTLSQIKREAYRWVQAGADTVEAADAYLKKLHELERRENRLLPLLGIHGRTAVEGEKKYLRAWLDWGFSEEAVALAYERTVLRRGSMNWAYMNSILKNWHAGGLHTPEQIEQGDGRPGPRGRSAMAPAPAPVGTGGPREADDMERMRRILAREKGEG